VTARSTLRQRDAAYACFLVVGIAGACATLASLYPDFILIALWLVLPALPAMLTGMILSIVQWRDGLLPLLSALTIALLVEVATEAGTVEFYNASTAIYAVLVLLIVASWFLLRRRRVTPEGEESAVARDSGRLKATAQSSTPGASKPDRSHS
jgi:hypothetical protein